MATTLKLDYDTARFPRELLERIQWLAGMLGARVRLVELHRTRRGWHAVVILHGVTLDPGQTVAAQSILGSDAAREMFNLVRAVALPRMPKFWRSRWNLLYAAKL